MMRIIKTLFLTSILLFIQISCSAPATPESNPTKVLTMTMDGILAIPSASIPLTGEWNFAVDQNQTGEKEGWADPKFVDSAWATVHVPHTWNVSPEYSEYEGLAWYRRTFTPPTESKNAHVRLRFDAVFYLARVWLNGQYLGQHEGGYTPFEFDVTSIVNPGKANTIAVQVDNVRKTDRIPVVINPNWSFDWWNYGGITREVTLELTSRVYIARQQIVSVPHLTGIDEADTATVTTTITVNNTSVNAFDGTIQADLLDDATGQSVLSSPPSASFRVSPNSSTDVQLGTTITSPKLWHFDHPNLYHWSASLLDAK